MTVKGAVVTSVYPGSIGEELGIEPGDLIVAINNKPVCDVLDYQYLSADSCLEIQVVKSGGEQWILDIEKDYSESLGLEFGDVVFDGIKPCANRCIFCFVDQLPPGMRSSLYVKDDDYRLSFLYGNFITLTNLRPRDWDKLLEMRLSPLYISVHATTPEVRKMMLAHRKAGSIMTDLKRLQKYGIEVHTQIVLCPGINDGEVLDKSIRDLAALWPAVRSIGIVPVGLTGFRQGLPVLRTVTTEEARDIIELADRWQQEFRRRLGTGLVYLADEFFIKAGIPFPPVLYYDDFVQLENGIGMSRLYLEEFNRIVKSGRLKKAAEDDPVHIVCGKSALPLFREVVSSLSQWRPNLNLITPANEFFGGEVTVTGLLTGHDILSALKQDFKDQRVLLPSVLLKHGSTLLLDDMTIEELAEKSGAIIEIIDMEPDSLIDSVLTPSSHDKRKGEI